jgi:intracellular sulfur oxidation DsrE/DsrF family protein
MRGGGRVHQGILNQESNHMDRRNIFKVAAAGAAIGSFIAGARAQGDKKIHKLAIHIGGDNPDAMKTALNNAKNAHELYAQRGEKIDIEIVANSGGLHMLRDDTSPVKEEIRSLRKLDPKVVFSACNNTKVGMEKKEGKTIPMISEATIVQAGVVRLVELQELGYAYMRP